MTIDERIAKLVEHGAKVHARVDALATGVEKFRETTQLSFDRLAQAMMGLTEHIVDHQRRITDLEGGRS